MSGAEGKGRKQAYFTRLIKLLDEYPKVLLVGADNVGSNQMQKVRRALRGKAVLLMGKNTMIRKAIRGHLGTNPALEALLPLLTGNVGLIFTGGDLSEVRTKIIENKVAAPAKAGSISPNDVIVPKGNTGLEPTQTSFLQALNIASKINKGQVEIINDVPLLKKGDRVGNSEAALLGKLNIKPFSYGLVPLNVYDNGAVYSPAVLDLTDQDIIAKFQSGVRNIAAIGLQIHYPTIASVPHSLAAGYKNALSIGLETDYSFPQVQKIKDYLANPGAFSAAAPAASAGKAAETKVEEKKEEKPESDEDMGLSLFD